MKVKSTTSVGDLLDGNTILRINAEKFEVSGSVETPGKQIFNTNCLIKVTAALWVTLSHSSLSERPDYWCTQYSAFTAQLRVTQSSPATGDTVCHRPGLIFNEFFFRPRGVWKIKANFLSYGSENSEFRQKDTKSVFLYQKVPLDVMQSLLPC